MSGSGINPIMWSACAYPRLRLPATALVAAWCIVLAAHTGGCSSKPSVARSFEPGRHFTARQGVRLGLDRVTWDDEGVTLHLDFAAIDRPLVQSMRGVVFVLDGLVYPLTPVMGEPWPPLDEEGQAVLQVSPGMSARVVGRVELGRALAMPGVVSVRGLPSDVGDADTARLELEIPAPPTVIIPLPGAP